MKKLIIILALINVFSSCSEDAITDINEFAQNESISPPEWIQGEWSGTYIATDGEITEEIFLFTKHNFIANEVSYTDRFIKLGDDKLNCIEECTTSLYMLTVRSKLFTENYIFSFLSENEIECTFGKGVNKDWDNRYTRNFILRKVSG